jgi:hypothetical protein
MNKEEYKEFKSKIGEYFKDILEKEFNDSFELIDVLTPLTYERYNNAYKGKMVRQADIVVLKGSFVWLRAILDRSSYIGIEDQPYAPWDYVSTNLTTAINVDSDTSIPLNRQSFNYTPRKDYPKSSLNPQYDPEYYDMWKENFSKAYDRRMLSKDLGNVEKILICY